MRAVLLLSLLGACGRFGFDDTSRDAGVGGPGDISPTSYPARVLADQPRAYYRLDEQNETVAVDATGNGNDSGYYGGAAQFRWGVPGALRGDLDTAVQFDGVGNTGPVTEASVSVPVGTTWGSDFSIELMIKPLSAAEPTVNNQLFTCEHYLVNGFRTGWRDDLNPILWTTEAGASSSITGSGPLALNTWSHVVFVMRGATVEIWRDATLVASETVDYIPADSSAECGFGSFHGMPTHGVFDEVALYEYALSAAQIGAHFAAR
ncbi:hypothetical protein BH11MYX3_BH11MYX3_12970 [soil metagenome]